MNLFVGNLAPGVSQDDLEEIFGQFGRVSSAKVMKDRETGASRGFGFVEMQEKHEADAAMQKLNGAELKGNSIKVNEARPREEGGGGGFRGGRGGSGGGGGGGGGNRFGGGGGGGGGGGRRF